MEGVERDGVVLLVGDVDAVPALGPLVDQPAQPLVAVPRVHQQDVRPLFIVVAHEVVGEEGLPAARRPQHELVAVGDDALAHRLVRDVQVQRPAAQPVGHLDAERRGRGGVVRLPDEQAGGLLGERVEGLLGREPALASGDGGPEQRRGVHGVVTGLAAHLRQGGAGVVPDVPQPLRVLRPRHDVAVAPHGEQPEGMGLVQVFLRPLAVYLVGAAVAGERAHVLRRTLETLQGLRRVVEEHVHVADVAAGQHQPDGRGERQPAVRAVGGILPVTAVRPHRAGQVVRVGKRVHAQAFVPDAHHRASEPDVLQHRRVLLREGEVFLHQPGLPRRAGNLVRAEPFQPYQP